MKNLKNKIKIYDIVIVSLSVFSIVYIVFFVLSLTRTTTVHIADVEVKKIKDETEYEHKPIEKTKEYYIEEREREIAELKKVENEMIRFINYKGICWRYQEKTGIKIDISEMVRDTFTPDEIYLIQRVIETECYQCDFLSKANVASVVLNRLSSEKFSNDVEKLITSPYQFAYSRKYISYDTILALEYAFYYGDTTGGALFFHSMKQTNTFNNHDYMFTDEAGHHFYG